MDEQHIPRLEIGELPREVARLADDRPEVEWKLTPSSRATICAKLSCRDRRPDEQHVSSASPRDFADWMKISTFLRAASWPAKSARSCGRTAVSSSGRFSPETSLRGASATSGAFARGMKALRQAQFPAHGEADEVRGKCADKSGDRGASDKSMSKRDADAARKSPVDGLRAHVGPDGHPDYAQIGLRRKRRP